MIVDAVSKYQLSRESERRDALTFSITMEVIDNDVKLQRGRSWCVPSPFGRHFLMKNVRCNTIYKSWTHKSKPRWFVTVTGGGSYGFFRWYPLDNAQHHLSLSIPDFNYYSRGWRILVLVLPLAWWLVSQKRSTNTLMFVEMAY